MSAASRRLAKATRLAFRPTPRNLLHWASWATALGIEVVLVVLLRDGSVFGWEVSFTRACQSISGRNLVFDVTSTLTNTISWPFVFVFCCAVAATAASRRWTEAGLMAITFPLHVLAQFPKALIDRPRPSDAFAGIEGVGGFQSFPSGHAEFVVSFYGLLTYFALRRFRGHRARAAILAAFVAFAFATGFGRIAAGRHWPLDIGASYLVGLGLLSGLIWLDGIVRASRVEPVK